MKKFCNRSEANDEISPFALLKRCLLFCVISFIFSLLLLFVLSFIFIRFEDSTSYVSMIGKLSLYTSAFLCSIILARKNGSNHLFSGILLGGMITATVFIISLIYPGSTENSIIWLLLIPVSTLLGSFIGKKRTSKAFKHKRRRK